MTGSARTDHINKTKVMQYEVGAQCIAKCLQQVATLSTGLAPTSAGAYHKADLSSTVELGNKR